MLKSGRNNWWCVGNISANHLREEISAGFWSPIVLNKFYRGFTHSLQAMTGYELHIRTRPLLSTFISHSLRIALSTFL
jgi:hypothetical protein